MTRTAKYRALTGDESLLQRFKGAGSLNAARKEEAERHADNYIDRAFHEWNNAEISAPGAIPPQLEELAEIVATAKYIDLELSTRGRSASADRDSTPASLMRDADRIVRDILGTGFMFGAHGEALRRERGTGGLTVGLVL